MVLIRALCLAALVAACNGSLFDSHGSTDGGAGGDGAVPASCPSPCLADAAGDFDGTPTGSSGHWRYLDDTRNRMWTAMTGDVNEMTGAGMNKITPEAPVDLDRQMTKQWSSHRRNPRQRRRATSIVNGFARFVSKRPCACIRRNTCMHACMHAH